MATPWESDEGLATAPKAPSPWESDNALAPAAPTPGMRQVAVDPNVMRGNRNQLPGQVTGNTLPAAGQRETDGVVDDVVAGLQGSSTGLWLRGHTPDVVLKADASWWHRAIHNAGGVIGDLPEMIAGGMVGSGLGGAAGSVAGPIGTAVGSVIGGGAGTMIAPAELRAKLMNEYARAEAIQRGETPPPELTWEDIGKVAVEEGIVGAATGGAGKLAKLLAPTRVALKLTAEGAAQVASRAVYEGRMPSSDEFVDAAIMIAGMKAAGKTTATLRRIYTETGVRPGEVAAAVAAATPAVPAAAPKAAAPGMVRWYHGGSPEGVTGKLWFTKDLRDAEGWARRGAGMKVWYTDVPEAASKAMTGEDLPNGIPGTTRLELAAEYADKRQPYETGSASTSAPSSPIRDAILRGEMPDSIRAMGERAEVGPDLDYLAKHPEMRVETPNQAEQFLRDPKAAGIAPAPARINLDAVQSGEDLGNLTNHLGTKYAEEINAGRRGVVDWNHTAADATEWLKKNVGQAATERTPGHPISPAEILARKEVLSQALVEAQKAAEVARTDPTPENQAAFLRSMDIVRTLNSNFLGARAEAGRVLNILKKTSDDASRAKMIDAAIKEGGGADNATKMAKLFEALGDDPAAINKVLSKTGKFEDAMLMWKAGLLTSPVTHTANIVGNGVFAMFRAPRDAVAGLIGSIARDLEKAPAQDRARLTDALSVLFGMSAGLPEGLKNGLTELKRGGSADSKYSDTGEQRAERGTMVGKAAELMLRPLGAEDAVFKSMNSRGQLHSDAARIAMNEGATFGSPTFLKRVGELLDNPTPEMVKNAADAADRYTFNTKLTGLMGDISKMTQKYPALQLIAPFLKVPTHIIGEAIKLSPAAPINKSWREDFAAGGARRDRALADVATGTAMAIAIYNLTAPTNNADGTVSDSWITGEGPKPGPKRDAWLVNNQPYSMKINGKWYSYARIDPLAKTIGIAADMRSRPDDESMPVQLAMSFVNLMRQTPALEGVSNFVDALSSERKSERYLGRLIGSMVPFAGAVGFAGRESDSVKRQQNSVLDIAQERAGLRQGAKPLGIDPLAPKVDMFGEPIAEDHNFLHVFPFRVHTPTDDPVRRELSALGIDRPAPKDLHIPGAPGEKLKLTTAEQAELLKTSGAGIHQRLQEMFSQEDWKRLTPLEKTRRIGAVINLERKQAKHVLFDRRAPEVMAARQKVEAARTKARTGGQPAADLKDEDEE